MLGSTCWVILLGYLNFLGSFSVTSCKVILNAGLFFFYLTAGFSLSPMQQPRPAADELLWLQSESAGF